MAERSTKRRSNDPSLLIEDFLKNAGSPEEVLFKVNELLASQEVTSSRKNVRVPVVLPVQYNSSGKSFNAETYTLSQEGVFIKTPKPLPISSELEVQFILPGDKKDISIVGEVVHQSTMGDTDNSHVLSGMVVIFKDIRDRDRRRIDRFVRGQAKQMKLPR